MINYILYNTYLKNCHLSADKNLVIAKVDSTANDVPSEFNVKGFPTIYFVPAGGDKEPIVYDGAREVCTCFGILEVQVLVMTFSSVTLCIILYWLKVLHLLE